MEHSKKIMNLWRAVAIWMNATVSLLMVNINILQQTLFHFFQDAIGVKFQEILFKRENKQIQT